MGALGSGNFDNDTAADHLGTICDSLIRDIEAAMQNPTQLEPDEYWGVAVPCNIELLVLFRKSHYFGATLPDPTTATRWRDTYMGIWLAKIDSLKPKPKYREERLGVLTKLFANLIRLAKKG